MKLRLYDSLSRAVSEVEPRDPGRLTAYICGPTVYSYIHVGNARPYWLGQVLRRFVTARLGLDMRLVVNVTDVNDKIYDRAREEGLSSDDLARRYTEAYIEDTNRLGLGRPDDEPLASETVPQIIDLIQRLVDAGLAYASAGDVYFRVDAFPSYGALSGQRVDELIEGVRVEPGEGKHAPADFALWKARKPDEDTWWPSPWGDGRPGWHIECSAMAVDRLGPGFDLHGGGLDLLFPHHENERAQSEGAGDRPYARRWVHNGMLRFDSEKMSKSAGNVERLRDALDRVGAETLAAFFASASYRSPVDYDDEALERARRSNERFRDALRSARRYAAAGRGGDEAIRETAAQAGRRFDEALADDFDTPAALAVLHGLRGELNRAVDAETASSAAVGAAADELVAALDVLGLGGLDSPGGDGGPPAAVRELLEQREAARAARDFARSDELRDRIASLGFVVRDTPQGPELVPLDAAS